MYKNMRISLVVRTLAMICVAVPILVLASTDSATLQVGGTTGTCLGGLFSANKGYDSGVFGSYSPNGLTGGKTVTAVNDTTCGAVKTSHLVIGGFSTDPGQTWLTSVTCNSITKTSASGSTYNFGSGSAEWSWASQFGFVSISNGTNVSCSITHN